VRNVVALAAAAAFASPAIALAQAPAPAPTPHVVIAGTVVNGTIEQTLSSKTSKDGDTFTVSVKPGGFWHKNPDFGGCAVAGHIENVSAAGPTHKATMNAILDGLRCPGQDALVPVQIKLISAKTFEPQSHMWRDTGIVIASAVAGKMVSDKSGHKGGTMAGAAAGVALASTMKSDIVIKKGTDIEFKLLQGVKVPTTPHT
jgi:hypothetical protein